MSTSLIRLPSERADQLRLLADHMKMSMADVVAKLVTEQMKALGIWHFGLGATLDTSVREDGKIAFNCENVGSFVWDKSVATNVSDTILALAEGKLGGNFDLDAGLELHRVGTSVRLTNIETRASRTFAPSVAIDIAILLRSPG